MSNYTHRPTEMFCTEVNQEIFDLLKAWADKNDIRWNSLSLVHKDVYPMASWVRGTIVTGTNPNRYPVLSLADFIAKFKTPAETDAQERERLIEELHVLIGSTEYGHFTDREHRAAFGLINTIQSLKPKP